MLEWCIAHPWMTFLSIVLLLVVIDNCLGNLSRVKIMKEIMKNGGSIEDLKEAFSDSDDD